MNSVIFNGISLVATNSLQMFIIIQVSRMSYVQYVHQGGYSTSSANVFVGSFGCIICLAVIECGSKKALRKTQGCGMIAGWLRRVLR